MIHQLIGAALGWIAADLIFSKKEEPAKNVGQTPEKSSAAETPQTPENIEENGEIETPEETAED